MDYLTYNCNNYQICNELYYIEIMFFIKNVISFFFVIFIFIFFLILPFLTLLFLMITYKFKVY